MDYTVSLITNAPDCQALINIANAEKESLSYRRTGLLRQRQTATITSMEIQTELASVEAELAALQTVLDTLPEGSTKADTLVKFTKAGYKKFLLEQRKGNYGPIALVEKEYDIACVDEAITETDAFITSLTTRLADFPA